MKGTTTTSEMVMGVKCCGHFFYLYEKQGV